MTLVDDWKKCWKWLSIQAGAIGVAMSGTYTMMYEQLRTNLPPKYMVAATGAVFLLGIVGRLISQTPPDDSKSE